MAQQLTVQLPGCLRSVAVGAVRPGPAWAGTPAAARAQRAAEAQQELQDARKRIEAERERLQHACQALAAAAGGLRQVRNELLAEAEQQLLDLAVEIARKVLAQEIRASRHEVDPIVAEALKQVPPRCDVTVHLHPDDHARCKMAGELAGETDDLRFVADPDVLPGECFLETSQGTVESSIEGQLAEIAEALKQPE